MGTTGNNNLSLDEKIGQLFFIGISGGHIDGSTQTLLEEVKPGGVCLFARNIKDAGQTRRLTDDLRTLSPIVPLISIDQEGGLVDRLRRLLGPFPAAAKLKTRLEAVELAEMITSALRMLGFNMNFAPVVDVVDEQRSAYTNGLHSRAFGSSAQEAAELAGSFLTQQQSGGVVGCLKHFPGLGASQVDSHEELPVVDIASADLHSVDLLPYRSLLAQRKVDAIMIAHAAYPRFELQEKGQDGKLLPSSLSSNIVSKLLRNELGFDGLVLTDDLEMGAILRNYSVGEASLMAIMAGNDMVSICAGIDSIRAAHAELSSAASDGRLPVEVIDAAVGRILELKKSVTNPVDLDVDRIAAISQRIVEFNERLA